METRLETQKNKVIFEFPSTFLTLSCSTYIPDEPLPTEMSGLPKVNLDKPRWDQNTYWGRARYFFNTTNPINLLATPSQLDEAKRIVDDYKTGKPLPGKSMDDVWKAKDLVDSAFHPETGEKMIIFGRMSAQAPMNVFITGAMLTFYK